VRQKALISEYVTSTSKFDKGEKIDPQNLKIYKHLSAEDLASGPDWLFAPVLVATNQERINIT
jgi:hypothetical protein